MCLEAGQSKGWSLGVAVHQEGAHGDKETVLTKEMKHRGHQSSTRNLT